jgi:hypothetical protein
MGHAKELSGPDLAAGIELSELSEGAPLLGHAHGDAVMLVRRGTNIRAGWAEAIRNSAARSAGVPRKDRDRRDRRGRRSRGRETADVGLHGRDHSHRQ